MTIEKKTGPRAVAATQPGVLTPLINAKAQQKKTGAQTDPKQGKGANGQRLVEILSLLTDSEGCWWSKKGGATRESSRHCRLGPENDGRELPARKKTEANCI